MQHKTAVLKKNVMFHNIGEHKFQMEVPVTKIMNVCTCKYVELIRFGVILCL